MTVLTGYRVSPDCKRVRFPGAKNAFDARVWQRVTGGDMIRSRFQSGRRIWMSSWEKTPRPDLTYEIRRSLAPGGGDDAAPNFPVRKPSGAIRLSMKPQHDLLMGDIWVDGGFCGARFERSFRTGCRTVHDLNDANGVTHFRSGVANGWGRRPVFIVDPHHEKFNGTLLTDGLAQHPSATDHHRVLMAPRIAHRIYPARPKIMRAPLPTPPA